MNALAGSSAASPGRPARPEAGLGQLLTAWLCRPVKVEHVRRGASPFALRVPAEVLTVELDSGQICQLFLKSLGDEDHDHPDKQCRDRELQVYRHLFAGRRLPVPGWVGGGWNDTTGRHDLYLEYVDGWDLRFHGLDYWNLAASRLGALQRTFARRRDALHRHRFLLRLDAAYFQAWARRALESLRQQSTALARRYEPVAAAAGDWAEPLAAQPPTLVHNDLSGKNVLVDRSTHPARVCIVDWDLAGVGCGLLDLVHLSYGLDAAAAARLRGCYYRAVGGGDLLPGNRRALAAVLAACVIHETNVRLWCSRRWWLPDGRLDEWVDDTRAALGRIA
jgi:hypothetical protein